MQPTVSPVVPGQPNRLEKVIATQLVVLLVIAFIGLLTLGHISRDMAKAKEDISKMEGVSARQDRYMKLNAPRGSIPETAYGYGDYRGN